MVFFVVSRQQGHSFWLLAALRCQNCHMASRDFLKILRLARSGDVSAQQDLALVYLNGLFNTPIQPSNALIWLEKAHFSLLDQFNQEPGTLESLTTQLFAKVVQIPIAETLGSPAFNFGWDTFWKLTESTDSNIRRQSQWRLAELLLDPSKKELQSQLELFSLHKKRSAPDEGSKKTDLRSLLDLAKKYLVDLAENDTPFSIQAKELLIKLQPNNEALSSLWASWLEDRNTAALLQAAELGLTAAKLALGLQLAQLDSSFSNGTDEETRNSNPKISPKSNASLKKAAHWLELAAKDGDRDAWYALGEIYRRPQFSGYSATESDRCFNRAADLGHAQAQFLKGANLWRKRENISETVKGLQASYWVWQAQQQGVSEAKELLAKILESHPDPKKNNWNELAVLADDALKHLAEYKLDDESQLMCHRIIIANQFNFSKAELLLCEVGQLQHEHCIVIDIRWELPKILPRLVQIETIQQRRILLAAGKAFASGEPDLEGNLRQRRYRFDRVGAWLEKNFTKV